MGQERRTKNRRCERCREEVQAVPAGGRLCGSSQADSGAVGVHVDVQLLHRGKEAVTTPA